MGLGAVRCAPGDVLVAPYYDRDGYDAAHAGIADRSRRDKWSRAQQPDEKALRAHIKSSLKRSGLRYQRHDDLELTAARLLAEGKTVARFNGRCEFGPRALGNRSILYRADDPTVNTWLNRCLGRTETMPFAPATLAEAADEMFLELDGLDRCTRFMTIVVPCSDEMRRLSPAVVHVDGTARPQIVHRAENPSFHRILSEYYACTGIPSVINTSFNMHGEPIVCSPDDAIRCFAAAGLDCLAIGDFLATSPTT